MTDFKVNINVYYSIQLIPVLHIAQHNFTLEAKTYPTVLNPNFYIYIYIKINPIFNLFVGALIRRERIACILYYLSAIFSNPYFTELP